jgi:hypothetical protein
VNWDCWNFRKELRKPHLSSRTNMKNLKTCKQAPHRYNLPG